MRIMTNLVQLAGTLAADPELKLLTDGTPLAQLRLRVRRGRADAEIGENGYQHFRLLAWDALARDLHEFRKGQKLMIRGELRMRNTAPADRPPARLEIHIREYLPLSSNARRPAPPPTKPVPKINQS